MKPTGDCGLCCVWGASIDVAEAAEFQEAGPLAPLKSASLGMTNRWGANAMQLQVQMQVQMQKQLQRQVQRQMQKQLQRQVQKQVGSAEKRFARDDKFVEGGEMQG